MEVVIAKRFIDTALFDDSWFMNLSVDDKLFFIYLITNCDNAGIIDLNIKLAEFKTGIAGLSEKFSSIEEEFGKRLVRLRDNYFFIPRFIRYQYPNGLNPTVNAQKSVITRLSNFYDCECKLTHSGKETLKEVLDKSISTPLDKDKDKDKDKDIYKYYFVQFWDAYPKKKSKGQAEKTFMKIKPNGDLVKTMIESVEKQKKSEQWQKDNGRFIPYPSTWLNAKGWEDELEAAQIESDGSDKARERMLKTQQELYDDD